MKASLYLFIFILLLASALAIPILQTPQIGGQLIIQYPKQSYFLFNATDKLKFNVFNSTFANMSAPDTNCTLSIYNDTGVTIVNSVLTMDNVNTADYVYTLTGNVTNQAKIYNYEIFCTNTPTGNQTGFLSHQFAVSRGETMNDTNVFWPLGLLLSFGIIAMFYLGLSLDEVHYPMKLLFIWVGIFMFMLLSQLAVQMATSSYLDTNIISILTVWNITTIVMAVLSSLYFMYYVLAKNLGFLTDASKKNNLRSR
jgi:hypothetical protein